MDNELKAKWTAALRSGEFEQGQEALFKDGAYCCLGVLCKIAGADMSGQEHSFCDDEGQGVITTPTAWIDDEHYTEDEELMGLLDYFGVGSKVESMLISMNDTEKLTFQQIADWLDKHDPKTGRIISTLNE